MMERYMRGFCGGVVGNNGYGVDLVKRKWRLCIKGVMKMVCVVYIKKEEI